MNPCEAELLRVSEAAPLLSVSRSKAYELAETGQIPVVRIGRSVRIPRRDLLEWIKRQTVPAVAWA